MPRYTNEMIICLQHPLILKTLTFQPHIYHKPQDPPSPTAIFPKPHFQLARTLRYINRPSLCSPLLPSPCVPLPPPRSFRTIFSKWRKPSGTLKPPSCPGDRSQLYIFQLARALRYTNRPPPAPPPARVRPIAITRIALDKLFSQHPPSRYKTLQIERCHERQHDTFHASKIPHTCNTPGYRTMHSSKYPSTATVCASRNYRHCSGNRHYTAYYYHWLFPYVPSDSTGTIAGNRHYLPNHCCIVH